MEKNVCSSDIWNRVNPPVALILSIQCEVKFINLLIRLSTKMQKWQSWHVSKTEYVVTMVAMNKHKTSAKNKILTKEDEKSHIW